VSTSSGADADADADSAKPAMAGKDIAGIVIGTVVGITAIVSAFIAYRSYKKKELSRQEGPQDTLQLVHRGQQSHALGIPSSVFQGNGDLKFLFTQTTESRNWLSWRFKTVKKLEFTRDTSAVMERVIAVEEVD
jgi:hypothetical protein